MGKYDFFCSLLGRAMEEIGLFSNELLNENGFKSCSVVGRFASKRNQLYLLKFTDFNDCDKQMVYKLHNHRIRLTKEIEMLFQLKNSPVLVPGLVKVIGNGILMEHISGPTILEYISWQENIHFQYREPHIEPAMQTVRQLADWLMAFYDTTEKNMAKKMILGNINLRNFIIRENLYGVDFEDCREGYREEDAGRICAFTLTYTPPYTPWKKTFAKEMMDLLVVKLDLDRGRLINCLFSELAIINKRRGIRLRAGWIEDIFQTL
jgi:hypothetical protein